MRLSYLVRLGWALAALLLPPLFPGGPGGCCWARAEETGAAPPSSEDTMLMFVGEETPVVTAASRLPESPDAAPAMVTVVGREEIERHGYQTVAELLAQQPGFYLAQGGRGASPYLRGLRDSVLFLYDGVPVTTDATKSLAPLDQEISLADIDRVEIVRGPGSVLWGPDAFAGVVNIVPLRGRQRPGLTTGLAVGNERGQKAEVSWGLSRPGGDGFLAASQGRERFSDPSFTIDQVGGEPVSQTVDPSDYGEVTGDLNYGDWLHLSGHWSDFTRRYTMQGAEGGLRWPGEKSTPFNQLKATVSKADGPSHYTFSGYLQELDYRVVDADIERRQNNRAVDVEAMWDRRLFSRGLFTAGLSWRRNAVRGALVRDGFLPDFLAPPLPLFAPQVEQADFASELASLFTQFRYQWGETECWAGVRLDEHSQYGSMHSYSLGLNRPLAGALRLKATYGNAFRSPYASQLFANLQFEPESIRTASLQLAWSPKSGPQAELTLFDSRLDDHRGEDPYGGLSLPASQRSQGAEFSGRLPLARALDLRLGFTVLGSAGSPSQFRSLRYSFIRPDGSQVPVYDEWSEPFDQGPPWLANFGLTWRLGKNHSLQLDGRISGRVDYSYEQGTVTGSYSQPLILDLTYRRPGFRAANDTFTFSLTNLLEQNYQMPFPPGPWLNLAR